MSSQLVFDHYSLPTVDLPSGWETVSVGDVARLVASGFPSGEHNQDQRGTPHIRPMNIDREGRLDLSTLKYVEGDVPRRLASGDVLFNNTNSPELVGKTTAILVDFELAYSNHMTRIQLEDGLNPVFVARQLHFLWMIGYFRHRCVNHVNQASISADPLSKTVPLLLPPADEQVRIADTLDELLSDLYAGVAALERVRAKLALYRASVLKAAVEGALTAEWREQHPHAEPASELLERILVERRRRCEEAQLAKFNEAGKEPPRNWKTKYRKPVSADTSSLPLLPAGWCWSSLDQLGQLDRGKSKHRPRDAAFLYGGPYPFIQTGDVRRARQYVRDHTQTYSEAGLSQSRLWPAETLCITIAANIAETAILSYPACFPDSVVGVQFTDSLVSVRYVELFIRSAKTLISAYAPATAQKNINNEILRALAVPLPPLEEQWAIVDLAEDQMSVIEHLGDDLESKLKGVQALRQAILRHAFAGKLVPQDPNDEPASELLKRIAAERETRARESPTSKDRQRRPPRRRTGPKTP